MTVCAPHSPAAAAVQAVVRRFANPAAARVLSMDAVCTTLRVLRSAKQLASYNKSSGTILRNMARDTAGAEADDDSPAEVSDDELRAGAPALPLQPLTGCSAATGPCHSMRR